MFDFKYADKMQLEQYLPELFEILHTNMRLIAPTNNSYHEDFEIWRSYAIPAMQSKQRQIILMYVDNALAEFFRYYIPIDAASLKMEEIQIKKEYQGTGLFSAFYRWLVRQLPEDILFVEAYADKRNHKSQAVLKHLGLIEMGENKNGISLYYKGKYADLLSKYS